MSVNEFDCMRALVRSILERPHAYEWTVQGFGMMRAYPDRDKRWRLNIWDSRLAVPNVSTIHDHPWHFQSWVLSGAFTNIRYQCLEREIDSRLDLPYMRWRIQTGEGGGPREAASACFLRKSAVESLKRGMTYSQRADEVHESRYVDGCVTINDRRRLPDGEHAYVFWPAGGHWVDAEPRAATFTEIRRTLGLALEGWDR